jgi:hypothetical protein
VVVVMVTEKPPCLDAHVEERVIVILVDDHEQHQADEVKAKETDDRYAKWHCSRAVVNVAFAVALFLPFPPRYEHSIPSAFVVVLAL